MLKKVNKNNKMIVFSSEKQSKNQGFIRLIQYGNNNKTNIKTQGKDIDIDAIQKGVENTIDFDIRGRDTYSNIIQSGENNTFKGKYSLYNNDFTLIQYGKNNFLEIINKNSIPMVIRQNGNGIKMIIY